MMVVFLIMLQSQLVKWEVLCLSCSLPLQGSSRVSSVRQSLKMGDANLVNGAQMGPCVVQADGGNQMPTTAWMAGWQSSWQESIYLYCPLEVATVAQVLFCGDYKMESGLVYRAAIWQTLCIWAAAKRFARNYHPIRDIQVLINSLMLTEVVREESGKRLKISFEQNLANHFLSKLLN